MRIRTRVPGLETGAVAKLRNALGDSAESPRYIKTLPKRGYRFIAEVSVHASTFAKAPESGAGNKTWTEPEVQHRDVSPQRWPWPKRRGIVVQWWFWA
jgi:DNA-binding winged helix-turn-helix (wHTH) protein